jgi:hypothetical protein
MGATWLHIFLRNCVSPAPLAALYQRNRRLPIRSDPRRPGLIPSGDHQIVTSYRFGGFYEFRIVLL